MQNRQPLSFLSRHIKYWISKYVSIWNGSSTWAWTEHSCFSGAMASLTSLTRSASRGLSSLFERGSCWGAPGVPVLARGARGVKPGKGHKGARARFTLASSYKELARYGMFIRGRAGKQHNAGHKSNPRLERLSKPQGVSSADLPRLRKLMQI